MANIISGPGLGLPLPNNLYPSSLYNGAPFGENTNRLALAPGDAIAVPSGEWWVQPSPHVAVQWLDPITGSWRFGNGGDIGLGLGVGGYVRSDGFNVRVANLTGCVVGARVKATSAGWVQATTTITSSTGNSTWQAIVGGALGTPTISAHGSGYGIPPILIAPAPPNPGIPAQFTATISGGTVSAVTTIDQGAGYTASTVTLTVLTDPQDPNFLAGSAITAATIVVPVGSAGSITGAICTNPGAALSALPTLTASGAGSSATISPLWLVAASSISVSTAGGGYDSLVALSSFGGGPGIADAYTRAGELYNFIPRPISGVVTATAGALTTGAPAHTWDPGVFLVTQASDDPTAWLIGNTPATTVGAAAITLGGVNGSAVLQSL